MRLILLVATAGLLRAGVVHAGSEIWETCFSTYDACVKARTEASWRPDLAERLCRETDNGCAVPKDFYTYAACEKRAWDLKYKGVLLWADRNSIPAFCRNTAAEKYPAAEAKKNLR
jgi:hypothetical protein